MTDNVSEQRQRWDNKDIDRLLHLWNTFGSIMLIAAIMGRKPSSIQTQASRRQLPRRDSMPGHRRRWTDSEDDVLSDVCMKIHRSENIDILAVSKELERSIDAIINRLNQVHDISMEDIIPCIIIPTQEDLLQSGIRPKTQTKPMPTCPLCLKKFVPTSAFNRVCSHCKKSETWRMGV